MIKGVSYPYKTAIIKSTVAGDINYIDEGYGEKTLVFIHGLANYALVWKKNIDVLKDNYRCIAIDLPGNGLSEHGNFPYSIGFFSDVVADFVQQLQLKNIVLIGHSMGAQVAVTTLLHHPGMAEKLILCAPAGFETFTPIETGLYKATAQFFDFFSSEESSLDKIIKTSFYNYSYQADDLVKELIHLMHLQPVNEYRRMVDACVHGMLHEPVFNRLHLIEQATLIIFGEQDAIIPNKLLHLTTTRKIAEEGASKLKNAKLYILPQCGHFVQWEKSEEVNRLILSFLKG